jgi:4-amino-4-deoxy-L-arabinose transferase-like glycosyltransferase
MNIITIARKKNGSNNNPETIGVYWFMHLSKSQKQNALNYLILLVLIYFVVFAKLGDFPFRFWDESMFAVNAYEMEKNGNLMVPFFDNEVDLRNTKPLLLTWIQVGFIKLFGFSELTMRLPSAIAVSASLLALFSFLKRQVDLRFAWISSLILLTSTGYIGLHTGRTGDADALFSFFILMMSLQFANWMLNNKGLNLLLCFIFLSLAVLTKSFAAFLWLPGLLLTALLVDKSRFIRAFKISHFYVGLFVLIASLGVVFGIRELYQPGYINLALSNDASRVLLNADNHQQGWDFYLEQIFYHRFLFWSIPFVIGLILIQKILKPELKKLATISILLLTSYFILISISTTKLFWYDMPLYPFLACVAAIPIYVLFSQFFEVSSGSKYFAALILIFIIPYRKMFFESQSHKMPYGDRVTEMTSLYLHHQTKQNLEENITVFHYGYAGSALCYTYMYADQGKELKIKYEPQFSLGEKVFVSHENLIQVLNSKYETHTLETFETGVLVNIVSLK